MRPGQDRHEHAERVRSILLPADTPGLFGLRPGDMLTDARAAIEGLVPDGQGGLAATLSLPDPFESRRRLEVNIMPERDRVKIVAVKLFSDDRMDIDGPYKDLRRALDGIVGKPDREVSGTLTFIYRVPGAIPSDIRITRYKDAQQNNVLDVTQRP